MTSRRRTLVLPLLLVLVATLVSGIGDATPAGAAPPDSRHDVIVTGGTPTAVSVSPLGLSPAFAPTVHDYVLRCAAGVNDLTLSLGSGTPIRVGTEVGTSITVPVSVSESDAIVLRAPDPANPAATTEYWIRCLPADFPQMAVSKPGTVPDGWYLTGTISPSTSGPSTTMYSMVLDANGTPVWYRSTPGGAINTAVFSAGVLTWAPNLGPGIGADPNGAFQTYDLATQRTGSFRTTQGPIDPHELGTTPDGDKLLIATPLRDGYDLSAFGGAFVGVTTIVDCVIQITDASGTPGWTWRMSDHVDVSEALTTPRLAGVTNVNGVRAADVFHCNSVDLDPVTGRLLVSARHLNAVMQIDPTTGFVEWKLGGTPASHDGARILSVVGDPTGTIAGQHDARYRGSGSITFYDNNSGTSGPARGVEYAIDTTVGTATRTWQYAVPDGLPATATGSFRRSADGNDNVVGWGFKAGSGFTEVDASGNVLMEMRYPNGDMEYRVVKVPPSTLDVNQLRRTAGSPAPVPGWESRGGVLTSAPTVASWGAGRLDVFARGTDDALYHQWYANGAWSAWEYLGGVLTEAPAATAAGSGRLDVVVRGTDDGLYRRTFANGVWQPWQSLGGIARSAPGVTSSASGRLDIFVRGTDDALWTTGVVGVAPVGWQSLGGALTSAPAAASWAPGRMDVFVRGTDSQMHHRWLADGRWYGWESLGGVLTSAPAVSSWGPNRLDVYVRGESNELYHLIYAGTGWIPYDAEGAVAFSSPAVTSWAPGRLDLFAGNADGTLGHRWS